MKIMIIVTQMEAGGAQIAATRLYKGLKEYGCEVKLCFLYKKSDLHNISDDIIVISYQKPLKITEYIKLLLKLFRTIKYEDPKAVITFTHYANVIGQVLSYIARVPKRIASQRSPSFSHPKIVKILDMIGGTIGIYTDVIMVSQSVNDSYSKYPKCYRKRTQIIYNGYEPSMINRFRINIKDKYKINDKQYIVINVGRLAKVKNQKLIIETIKPFKNICAIIIGEGEERRNLERLIHRYDLRDRALLLGEIPNDEVLRLLFISDILMFPSIYEGMSNSLIEAMSVGIPILASDIPANRELLKMDNGLYSGVLIDPNDYYKWKNALDKMINNEYSRKYYGALSRYNFNNYSLNKMIEGFLYCLNS